MASPDLNNDSARGSRDLRSWLDAPLSSWSCVIGWCLATALFFVVVRALQGPGPNDTYESVFSTWAIAHERFACAFPAGYRDIAPVYPLFSGAISAIERAGRTVAFPPSAAFGPHCDRSFLVINSWSLKSGALQETLDIGYAGWIVLMGGLVAVLRACGRGRCRWEPATLLLAAVLPAVWSCVQGPFHPQDLFAMGFALAAMACVRRSAWAVAGVFVGLAMLSQQFAVLVAIPLLVLAPGLRKLTYAAGAVGVALLVTVPFAVANARGTAHAVIFGTGTTGGIGGTVLWELDLHGAPLVLLSRIAPIALSLVIAWWTVRRIGSTAAMEPVALISLIAVCVSLRLVFEQQLFGYYFMALSVSLIVLDVVRGHLRSTLAAWLATTSVVYLLGSTQLDALGSPKLTLARCLLPLSVIVFAAILIVRDIGRAASPWRIALWVAMICVALVSWSTVDEFNVPPTWVWQVVFVPSGIALAAGPLLGRLRNGSPKPRPGRDVLASSPAP